MAMQGPTFGFTKADMSGKVQSFVDMSYLSEATGRPADQLSDSGALILRDSRLAHS